MSLAAVLFVRPFREHSLVQVQENGVERFHLTVKNAFHVSVSSQRLLDVSNSTAFRAQHARFEVVDVFVVVEHESDGGRVSVDLEWMSTEHSSLENDSVGCAGK